MLFGDRLDFAIEAEVEPGLLAPSPVWGRICVWCRGVALGDIEEACCALYPAYLGFRHLPERLDGLWSDKLEGLDDKGAWEFLDGLLYGCRDDVIAEDERTIEQCRQDWQLWSGHNFLTNWGESFDGYKSFILCPPDGSVRILSRGFPEQMGRGVSVSRTGVVLASQGFTRWFEEQARRLEGDRDP